MNISKTIFLASMAVALAGWQPAFAGFAQNNQPTMGGSPLFQMSDAYGFTGQHRAWLTQDALDNALVLATDRSPQAVRVDRENGAVVVLLDGRRIATVDSNSADRANMSPDALAQEWANAIKGFLSDSGRTNNYLATLKHDNRVASMVGKVERTMYAPAGMSFQIKLSNALNSKTLRAGDPIQAVVNSDVPLGNYTIPAGSVVIGVITEDQPDNFGFRFHSIQSANGRTYPIESLVTTEFAIASRGPHAVCTYAIPSGMANGVPLIAGRIPSGIGVGTIEDSELNALVFHRGTADSFTSGKLLFLQLESTSGIAVSIQTKML